MHPEDVERFIEDSRAAYESHAQLTTTYRIRTEAGDERWV
jgi:hypothetical protein